MIPEVQCRIQTALYSVLTCRVILNMRSVSQRHTSDTITDLHSSSPVLDTLAFVMDDVPTEQDATVLQDIEDQQISGSNKTFHEHQVADRWRIGFVPLLFGWVNEFRLALDFLRFSSHLMQPWWKHRSMISESVFGIHYSQSRTTSTRPRWTT
jgi:hypothetical protein